MTGREEPGPADRYHEKGETMSAEVALAKLALASQTGDSPVARAPGRFAGGRDAMMAMGDSAQGGPGNTLGLFSGPTPAGAGDEPRAAFSAPRPGSLTCDFAAPSSPGHSVSTVLSAE